MYELLSVTPELSEQDGFLNPLAYAKPQYFLCFPPHCMDRGSGVSLMDSL